MDIKIVVDSCCDLTKKMEHDIGATIAPLTIRVEDREFVDDDSLLQADLLGAMRKSAEIPRTACPSPSEYAEAYRGREDVFVVTLSDKLSGSYNSAMLGRAIVLEETPEKKICVINSKSASSGEVLIALKLKELIDQGLSFEEIEKAILTYRDEQKTFFVLESLDNLIKSGRITGLAAAIASVLSVKPIMKATPEGEIAKHEAPRGMKKATRRFVEVICEECEHPEERVLSIAHCNCPDRAEHIRDEVAKRCTFKDVVIVETRGISTVYANDGGVVVAF